MNDFPRFSSLANRKLHLGVCGSVAAYKAVEIMRALQQCGVRISVTLTHAATQFITPLTFEALGAGPVYGHMFDQGNGMLFGHLQPGQCADAMLIAPATATSMARLAAGMADDMLAAQALAFSGPLVLAPAMNPRMWRHPATQANMQTLLQRGCSIICPNSGIVACGDTGEGKLADTCDIAFAAAKALTAQDFAGKTILLTLGPTREQWDGVRVWTNLSTGKMGAALAQAACLRGAHVVALAGPGCPRLPNGVERHDVLSARDMLSAAHEYWPQCEFGIFCAAVADFYPEPFGAVKFKKQDSANGFSLRFLPNPDILTSLGAIARPEQRLLGFAAETEQMEMRAKDKLVRKKMHMIAGNLVGRPDSGFASATNSMFVCDVSGREERWPSMSKDDVAWRLLDWLLSLSIS